MNNEQNYRLQAVNKPKKRGRFWLLILLIAAIIIGVGAFFTVRDFPDAVKPVNQATKDQPVSLKVDADSAVVADLTTGQVLGQKNPNTQTAIASESKLLVAYGVLKAIENHQMNWTDQVTIPAAADLSSQNADVISHLNVKTGDKVSVRDLYWSMFTNSANDAAWSLTAALTKPGKTSQETLQGLASELHLKGSAWYNGAGLKNGDALGNQVSSASDSAANHASALQIAELGAKVMNMDPTLKTLTANPTITYTKNKTVKVTETSEFGQKFANIIKGLDNPNNLQILGLKTGSTPEAGACFTGYVVDQQGHEFITVINNAADYTDNKERFQKTIDMVNEVLAKKTPHSFSVGSQIKNHKTIGVAKEKTKIDVQVADNKTYWTNNKKILKVKDLSDLESRPSDDNSDVLAYAEPDMRATYLPGYSQQQKSIPLSRYKISDKK
ncbi:D-alanyl-D-alanine carboxypeptidase [Fructobacillus pseudoficulneus]|uniref:D-alanyl-D-alanine carboxypeptidase n=1 Tax=Fructobacillus pseudoficulneus TaxID=220714 RepID=A0A3F3GSK1_9LACO|nr:serine hydrolase [Fructobacillus pseudoficulneus]GAP02545.1 D-alanyl-D-alanine carboxypeptidase [Fructobacillus pseudoficulneus]SEH47248.1 D-alanyl-D-alanine carboxypeptidase (penicillin-binding protein 5/6) [Fructobacillus pseudoficulneus]